MPDYTGTTLAGTVKAVRSLDPADAAAMFADYIAEYIENPVKDADGYRAMTGEEVAAAQAETARTAALERTVFTKLQIRRAMRSLGLEATLDALLDSDAVFKTDWTDALEIDLSDRATVQALAASAIDIAAVKLKIAGEEF